MENYLFAIDKSLLENHNFGNGFQRLQMHKM